MDVLPGVENGCSTVYPGRAVHRAPGSKSGVWVIESWVHTPRISEFTHSWGRGKGSLFFPEKDKTYFFSLFFFPLYRGAGSRDINALLT
jgi:hypothetical protein